MASQIDIDHEIALALYRQINGDAYVEDEVNILEIWR